MIGNFGTSAKSRAFSKYGKDSQHIETKDLQEHRKNSNSAVKAKLNEAISVNEVQAESPMENQQNLNTLTGIFGSFDILNLNGRHWKGVNRGKIKSLVVFSSNQTVLVRKLRAVHVNEFLKMLVVPSIGNHQPVEQISRQTVKRFIDHRSYSNDRIINSKLKSQLKCELQSHWSTTSTDSS